MGTTTTAGSGSVLTGHFPEIRFEQGERRLWNPVRRNLLADRPEERVRLQLAEWLHLSCGQPLSRFTTETPVRQRITGETLRTDLLCYDKHHRPWLLAECKAPEVRLTRETALQAARYNLEIGAPLLLLTNGIRDLFFEVSDGGITARPLSELETGQPVPREISYWQRRGFLGQQPILGAFQDSVAILNALHRQAGAEIHLIKIPAAAGRTSFSHYFFWWEGRLISSTAGPDGGTALEVLHLQKNQITGHLHLPLPPESGEDAPQASLTDTRGTRLISPQTREKLLCPLPPGTPPETRLALWKPEFDAIFG